jgi:hypothetical protein
MTNSKRNRHSDDELIIIFNQENINKKYLSLFLSYYVICFNELFEDWKDWNDEDFEDGDSVQASALFVAKMRVKIFAEQIAKGHGEEWAQIIVNNSEEGERAIYFAYQDLMKINSELAKKELLIYCKSLGGDKYFEKYYIYLFEISCEINDRIEKARTYSRIFNEQLTDGKPKEYAHDYADSVANQDYLFNF